ncbi:hypothetical protein, partial [Dermacoccus nishinomiyaensis]|uniref:hypothetical protein n=1 Tax=Dermacoccus nishinomiyaensis TaxID=1274 RepID=UPI001C93076B
GVGEGLEVRVLGRERVGVGGGAGEGEEGVVGEELGEVVEVGGVVGGDVELVDGGGGEGGEGEQMWLVSWVGEEGKW